MLTEEPLAFVYSCPWGRELGSGLEGEWLLRGQPGGFGHMVCSTKAGPSPALPYARQSH